MKKVLITGTGGFIARHCIPLLRNKKYLIHGTVLNTADTLSDQDDVFWHPVNLLDRNAVSELVKIIKPTHLLHFGWYTEHRKFWDAEENLDWTSATIHLIKEFKKNGGERFVGAGSCAEYDWRYGYCTENITPLNPSSLYGKCKNAVRLIAQEYAALHKISFAWGRIFFLYGPHENPNRLISYVITSLLKNRVARCSNGTQIRDFMHVVDVANAFVALLDSDIEGPVNIASGNPLSLKHIIDIIGEIINRQDLILYGANPGNPGDPAFLAADVQRLNNELQWNPEYGINEGLQQTIHWWKNHLKVT